MAKIRPLNDHLLVERLAVEEKSPGGIIIPDKAKVKPVEGKVVAVGNGVRLESGELRPLDVKPGDGVLFNKYGGTEVKVDGAELLMLREGDVLGVLER